MSSPNWLLLRLDADAVLDQLTGTIDYFGMADFVKNTLVLRYSGTVCYKHY